MAKRSTNDQTSYLTDDDSGISLDRDLASATSSSVADLYSSTSTLIESIPSSTSSQTTIIQRRLQPEPVLKVISDGLIERVRPVTMKNSSNGDYIVCRTERGTFVAHRNPVVPDWVTRLVEEIERIQR